VKVALKARAALAGYGAHYRLIDRAAVCAFSVLAAWSAGRLLTHPHAGVICITAAIVCGWLTTDLLSGLVHWAFDTWGSVHTPVLGRRFIRPFREHHWDPQAMTQHDFVEVAGSSCLAALPLLAACAYMPMRTPAAVFTQAVLLSVALGVLVTNQCHKWAHMPAQQVPAWVRLAQRLRLVLHPDDHLLHHVRPFDSHYCTASGWLNRPLQRIRFFRCLERLLSRRGSTPPRADDLS
jgi:ubiquitin-conjugating enzyme E2 variant